jgi:hypothetical protein
MEATVLTFLFVVAFAAIRICVAERKVAAKNEDSYSALSSHHRAL